MADKTKTTAITNVPYGPVAKNVFIITLILSIILLLISGLMCAADWGLKFAGGETPNIDVMDQVHGVLGGLVRPIWFVIGAIIVVQLYNLLYERIGPIEVALK